MSEETFDFPEYSPEFEVWNHIEGAIDQAENELSELGKRERSLVEQVAALVTNLRTAFVLDPQQRETYQLLNQLLANPWFKHAADLQLVRDGVYRASGALDRYLEIEPVFTSHRLEERPTTYLAEAIRTYAMGFDAAAIAFCGATLERVLHEALQRNGSLPVGGSDEDRTPPMSKLLRLANESLLSSSQAAAKRLVNQRDRVMHRHIWESKVLAGVARQCIEDLAEILAELPALESELR